MIGAVDPTTSRLARACLQGGIALSQTAWLYVGQSRARARAVQELESLRGGGCLLTSAQETFKRGHSSRSYEGLQRLVSMMVP